MELLWATDIHLNCLPAGGARAFGGYVAEENPNADAIVVTGDLAEFHSVVELIEAFADGFGKPVWFVHGNHDAYGGSISELRVRAKTLTGKARWLESVDLVQLAPGVALVGQDGWYDAHFGDYRRSQIVLNDWLQVKELKRFRGDALVKILRGISASYAEQARDRIANAIHAGNSTIVFATHVPPFVQSSWHEGKVSDSHWLPWMTSRSMGDMLGAVALQNPNVKFIVLCGHTHGAGVYERGNLVCHTGHSAYYAPRVCGSFTF